MSVRRLVTIAVSAALLPAGPAAAQLSAGGLDEAARTLESSPVFVGPGRRAGAVRGSRSSGSARRSAATMRALSISRCFPARPPTKPVGDPDAALREVALAVGEPGTYAGVIGDSFRAGTIGGVLPPGAAGTLATQALEAERDAGTAAVLEDFVRRVGEVRAGGSVGGGDSSSDGGGFPVVLLALLAIPAALLGLSRWRRRSRERAQFAEVHKVARDDVIALGGDIRSLDLDMEMPDVDPEAKQHYGLAVERYSRADEALQRARRPEDLRPVSELLEEGRWAMEAARAEMANRPAPERRSPCFFDPRHGPSVTDVEWAPPGGQPRPVPACAADAVRIEDGQEPNTRRVPVNGELVPYWQAGPAFGPGPGGSSAAVCYPACSSARCSAALSGALASPTRRRPATWATSAAATSAAATSAVATSAAATSDPAEGPEQLGFAAAGAGHQIGGSWVSIGWPISVTRGTRDQAHCFHGWGACARVPLRRGARPAIRD